MAATAAAVAAWAAANSSTIALTAAIASATATVASGYQSYKEGKEQQKAYNINADILRQNAARKRLENSLNEDILRQENREKLSASLALGLGGSLDVYAGTVKRAPKLFIKLNLEWFYRLIKQPSRIGRMMKLPKFLFGTIFYKLSGKDKKQAKEFKESKAKNGECFFRGGIKELGGLQ